MTQIQLWMQNPKCIIPWLPGQLFGKVWRYGEQHV